MAARYVNIDHDTPMLLPVDIRDWVVKDHMVHFILEAVKTLNLDKADVNHSGSGSAQYPPGMMLGLLIYAYATGTFSSRQIERLTYENVAVRYLCADTHPDHDSICTFRRKNEALFKTASHQVLELAARMKILKVGDITLSIDGTKIYANASKHSAVSHGHAVEQIKLLEDQIKELVAKAENADSTPLQDGLSVPKEIKRREDRIEKLKQAAAIIEARHKQRLARDKAEHEAKKAGREKSGADTGKKPKPPGNAPQAPKEQQVPKSAQMNYTDPESRIMPMSGSKDFGQCYNAQAGVEVDSRLIVAGNVVQATNDKEQLVPVLKALSPVIEGVANVLADSGYYSAQAVAAVEKNERGEPSGTTAYIATKREAHQRSIQDLEKHDDAALPDDAASEQEKMRHRIQTKAGKELYKKRQQTVEPVFGIIKSVMGFRRFSLRGLKKVKLEWTLVTMCYNVKRLFTVQSTLKTA